MRLVISGNYEEFDKAINENKNIGVLLKSKENRKVTYIIRHKTCEFDGRVIPMIINDRLILGVGIDLEYAKKNIEMIHSHYFSIFGNEDILTKKLDESLRIIHTEIKQSKNEHEAIMPITYEMIEDVIDNIKKYNLCEITEIGLLRDGFFLRIYSKDISDYKTIDILMDDNYSVLFEKRINFIYGREWMSYSNLFFCSKFKIRLLTLNEFKRREFDKQMDAETGNTIPVNFNAKYILTRKAVIIAGFERTNEKSLVYKKGNTRITFDENCITATIKVNGISYKSIKLSDEQLTGFLETGIITEISNEKED